MNYEDDLHNCTPERLAEMLEEQGKIFGEFAYPFLKELLTEAAHRLREIGKTTYKIEEA